MKNILTSFMVAVAMAFVSSAALAQQEPAAVDPATPPAAPAPSWLQYQNPYVGEENSITNPHRTGEEITTWAQQAAADVLSFGPADYSKKLEGFKTYFNQAGWLLYAAYLQDTKLYSMVKDGGYSVASIVDRTPTVINQGTAGGAFHWLVRMPVTITFFSTDAAGKSKPDITGKYTLLLDIARMSASGTEDDIAITSWRMEAPGTGISP